jgi:CheY-like chemotaxis protein
LSDPNKTILIVEDEPSDALLLEHSLRRAGVGSPIVTLPTGRAALDYLEGKPPYLNRQQWPVPSAVFLDLKLPDISGLDVLKWIALQPPLRRLIVIVHSGYEGTKDLDALYAAGANSFIRKSSDGSEIQNVVSYFRNHFAIKEQDGGRDSATT